MGAVNFSASPADLPYFLRGSFDRALQEARLSEGRKYIVYREGTREWVATAAKAELAIFREKFGQVHEMAEKTEAPLEKCLRKRLIEANRWNNALDKQTSLAVADQLKESAREVIDVKDCLEKTTTCSAVDLLKQRIAELKQECHEMKERQMSLRQEGERQGVTQETSRDLVKEQELVATNLIAKEKELITQLEALREALLLDFRSNLDIIKKEASKLPQGEQEFVSCLVSIISYEYKHPGSGQLISDYFQIVKGRATAKSELDSLLKVRRPLLEARRSLRVQQQKNQVLLKSGRLDSSQFEIVEKQLSKLNEKCQQVDAQFRLANTQLMAAERAYDAHRETRLRVERELRHNADFKNFYQECETYDQRPSSCSMSEEVEEVISDATEQLVAAELELKGITHQINTLLEDVTSPVQEQES